MGKTIPRGLRTVITGGGSGLGRAFCCELAPSGARIVVSDIDLEGAEETAQLIRDNGGEALAVQTDVAKWDQVQALEATAREWLGEVDLLINNAGVAVRGGIETVSLEDWEWIMGINVWGVIYGCRAFLPGIKARGNGYIINIASIAGLIATPRMGPYNVTKAAVVSLSETLYTELANTDINVAVVCPTFFQTNILDAGRGERSEKALKIVTRAMKESKIQAPDVVRSALDAVLAGDLYVLPMKDGRRWWRFKRFLPEYFHRRMIAPKRK